MEHISRVGKMRGSDRRRNNKRALYLIAEYEEIQKLRQLWSRGIGTWNQIIFSLLVVVITAFGTLLLKFRDNGWDFQFLLLLWGLLTAIVLYWRLSVFHIDRNIVGLYRRMLELEKETGMEIQADYYFRNLTKRCKRELAKKIGVQKNEIRKFLKYDFKDFKDKVNGKKTKEHPIDYLLEIWSDYKWKSVTGRGHGITNLTFGILLALFLIGILGYHHPWSDVITKVLGGF